MKYLLLTANVFGVAALLILIDQAVMTNLAKPLFSLLIVSVYAFLWWWVGTNECQKREIAQHLRAIASRMCHDRQELDERDRLAVEKAAQLLEDGA